MKFISILQWLAIFIVGSLIVNFIIVPESFETFKQNVQQLIPERLSNLSLPGSNNKAYLIIESEMPCSEVGAMAHNLCKFECSFYDLEYDKYKCVKNSVECYCPKK